MLARILFVLLSIVSLHVQAQSALERKIISTQHGRAHLRLSLITCTTGRLLTEWAGHSAIRLVDSTLTGESSDLIYNFGTFSFDEQEFPGRFIAGQIDARLEVAPFRFFVKAYGGEDRGMMETVLLLSDSDKNNIVDALTRNAQPAARDYNYDFVFDNCTTRIRDLLTKALGTDFVLGQAAAGSSGLQTYRQVCYDYTERNAMLSFMAGIFLSQRADRRVDNVAAMFVPSYLFQGYSSATLRGLKISSEPITILADGQPQGSGGHTVFIIVLIIALLMIAGSIIRPLAFVGTVMTNIVLIGTGMLGLVLLYTWYAHVHIMCRNNYNVLWLLPFNAAVPWLRGRAKSIYAIAAMLLLCAALVVHAIGVQLLPFMQLWPLVIALVFIYIRMLRPHWISVSKV